MRSYEKLVSEKIKSIIQTSYSTKGPDWNKLMDKRFSTIKDDIERSARKKRLKLLQTLYKNKFSILTGKAGTGKTEVISLLIQGLCELENAKPSDFLV